MRGKKKHEHEEKQTLTGSVCFLHYAFVVFIIVTLPCPNHKLKP